VELNENNDAILSQRIVEKIQHIVIVLFLSLSLQSQQQYRTSSTKHHHYYHPTCTFTSSTSKRILATPITGFVGHIQQTDF